MQDRKKSLCQKLIAASVLWQEFALWPKITLYVRQIIYQQVIYDNLNTFLFFFCQIGENQFLAWQIKAVCSYAREVHSPYFVPRKENAVTVASYAGMRSVYLASWWGCRPLWCHQPPVVEKLQCYQALFLGPHPLGRPHGVSCHQALLCSSWRGSGWVEKQHHSDPSGSYGPSLQPGTTDG